MATLKEAMFLFTILQMYTDKSFRCKRADMYIDILPRRYTTEILVLTSKKHDITVSTTVANAF